MSVKVDHITFESTYTYTYINIHTDIEDYVIKY